MALDQSTFYLCGSDKTKTKINRLSRKPLDPVAR